MDADADFCSQCVLQRLVHGSHSLRGAHDVDVVKEGEQSTMTTVGPTTFGPDLFFLARMKWTGGSRLWLGRVSTKLHCTHHVPSYRLKDTSASFLLPFNIFTGLGKFGNCRGRWSSPSGFAERDLGSPGFVHVMCLL